MLKYATVENVIALLQSGKRPRLLGIDGLPCSGKSTESVVVEGVSSLNSSLCNLYDLKIFVESDRTTISQAALERGVGTWADHWRNLFLPSVDFYMLTRPQERADFLIAGRGAHGRTLCGG
jgi:hypothetical protein